MKIRETIRCCSFFLRTHVKISSKISIIEFNIQIKWCIIVTPSREAEKDYQEYFNSPPHKKNHIATTMINAVLFKISTHILTKRMTAIVAEAGPEIVISTHILTKRMTKIKIHNDVWKVISTHILTKRMTTFTSCKTFKGRKFQLTSSRRGWRPCFLQASHSCIFQLTSSRRGWRKLSRKSRISGYFNSHPHEEDDQVEMATRYMTLHFNSHPHEEDDPTFSSLSSSVSSFQLTSSRRGWPCGGCFVVPHSTFQLTSSRRGRLFLAWLLQALLYFNSHPHEEDDHFCYL